MLNTRSQRSRGKQEEEKEFGERKTTRKQDLRQPSEQERIGHEMTHLPCHSWCGRCIIGRGRDEDCRKLIEEERQFPETHSDCMFMGDVKEENIGNLGCKRTCDKSGAQYRGPEESDGGMDMPKADGMAA